ncbi:hypothetical protein BGZ98_000312 [Dissophora globulifera]|nr:hypothetical protein BGZ98_000312 [Dissophora globulifera]
MTIAGRKFRFESNVLFPRTPLQATSSNTPGRQIINIQATIDDDLQILAEIPSPTAGRTSSASTKSTARSAAALQSSLGLFTPNRAAKLSSLLVSPKPVPLPAFLVNSNRQPSTPKKVFTMIDEPSVLNPTYRSTLAFESEAEDEASFHTPTKEKRKAPVDFEDSLVGRTPKKVSFGPALSPEIFDKAEPPSTPVKRGQQQGPETPRRMGVSTPSLLSKLTALKSSARPILTPSRLSRASDLQHLEKPAPLNLFAHVEELAESSTADDSKSPMPKLSITPRKPMFASFADIHSKNATASGAQDAHTLELQAASPFIDAKFMVQHNNEQQAALDDSDTSSDNSENGSGSSGSDDGFWKKLTPIAAEKKAEAFETNPFMDDLDLLDDESSPPSTPTRKPLARLATPTAAMPSILTMASEKRSTPSSAPFSTPSIRHADDLDITPVHTPVRRPASSELERQDASRQPTPGTASRLALLQLSAQKVQGLADLLQQPHTPTPTGENADPLLNTPTRPPKTASLFDYVAGDESKAAEQSTVQDVEAESQGSTSAFIADDVPHLASSTDAKRRASAPAATIAERSQSPIFSGLRSVFRTPQKVVESYFAGFAGLRNFVMTPTKSPSQQPSWQQPIEDELASEPLDQDDKTQDETEESEIPVDISGEAAMDTFDTLEGQDSLNNEYLQDESTARISASTPTTPNRRLASHEDVMVFLKGHPNPQQKSTTVVAATLSKSFLVSRTKDEISLDESSTGEEEARQAELLRLLGEGAAIEDDTEEDVTEELGEEHEQEQEQEHEHRGEDRIDEVIVDDALERKDHTPSPQTKMFSRRISSTFNRSREGTPTSKRRQSLKQRLGSTSPGFRHYEQQIDSDEEEDEEDDMVIMISPKLLFVDIHQTKYAPHNKRKLAEGETEPESMKEKVARELELAKLRKQVAIEKPKKTIKKKPLSTKAKIRKGKTLERGLMNTEKDEKRIDKHQEKVSLKKRGKQMWE